MKIFKVPSGEGEPIVSDNQYIVDILFMDKEPMTIHNVVRCTPGDAALEILVDLNKAYILPWSNLRQVTIREQGNTTYGTVSDVVENLRGSLRQVRDNLLDMTTHVGVCGIMSTQVSHTVGYIEGSLEAIDEALARGIGEKLDEGGTPGEGSDGTEGEGTSGDGK
jgi:hypothetical protein